jgi:hypothetical protein
VPYQTTESQPRDSNNLPKSENWMHEKAVVAYSYTSKNIPLFGKLLHIHGLGFWDRKGATLVPWRFWLKRVAPTPGFDVRGGALEGRKSGQVREGKYLRRAQNFLAKRMPR